MLAALAGAVAVFTAKERTTRLLFLVLPPMVWILAHTFLADDLGIRYILFALPFGCLLGGSVLAELWAERLLWKRAVAVMGFVWCLVALVGVFPDHLSYFNEVACVFADPSKLGWDGGSKCGAEWLDDSNVDWGQSLPALKAWIDKNAPNRKVHILTLFKFPPSAYGIDAYESTPNDLTEHPPGLYVVSAHLWASLHLVREDENWMRTFKPIALVGHSLYIYDLP